jgi:hypothetical protein
VTLIALGWRRRQLRRQLLQEFAVVAFASGLLAVLAAAITGHALGHHPALGWAALGLPAAGLMTTGAAWLPVRRATAEAELHAGAAARQAGARPRWQQWMIAAGRTGARPRWQQWMIAAGRTGARPRWQQWMTAAGRPRRQPWMIAAGNLGREPLRIAAGALVIAAACAALGEELALRWAFGGVLVGSFLGRPVSWQAGTPDVAAVVMMLAMATITIAGLDWLTAAGRAVDLRTLRAIGWPAFGAARLVAGEAARLGLAGGLTAGALDLAGSLAVVHQVPGRMLAAAAAAAGAGLVLSFAAAGLSAVTGHGTSILRLQRESRPAGRGER